MLTWRVVWIHFPDSLPCVPGLHQTKHPAISVTRRTFNLKLEKAYIRHRSFCRMPGDCVYNHAAPAVSTNELLLEQRYEATGNLHQSAHLLLCRC